MTHLMPTSLCSGNILKFPSQLEAKTMDILSALLQDTFSTEVLLCVVTAAQMCLASCK